MSMTAGAVGRGFMEEGHLAHNGLVVSECMGSRKAGKWFREQRSRGQKLKFMMRQTQRETGVKSPPFGEVPTVLIGPGTFYLLLYFSLPTRVIVSLFLFCIWGN